MIFARNQNWRTSPLPFSLSLANTVTTGTSFDTASHAVANTKAWAAAGFRGFGPRMQFTGAGMDGLGSHCHCGGTCGHCGGLGGLTFDGTGLFGTGLFSGDPTTWGIPEVIAGGIGAYALYAMFFQAKQTKYRLEASAQRRRKTKAAKYRAKAQRLEAKGLGGIFA
jgi:hypothetical protein